MLREDFVLFTVLLNLISLTTGQTEASTSLTETSIYQGCGSSKGCWGDRVGCITAKSCLMLVTYVNSTSDPEFFQIELLGQVGQNSAGYIAMGLSTDRFMGADSVVACTSDDTLYYDISMSLNIGKVNKLLEDVKCNNTGGKETALKKCTANVVTGRLGRKLLLCQFLLNKHIPLRSLRFSPGDRKYYILTARAEKPGIPRSTIPFHVDATSSRDPIGFWETNTKDWEISPLVRAHGSLMIIIWILIVPIGITIARYFKESCILLRCCERRIWWGTHMGLMTLAVGLLLVSITCIVTYSMYTFGQFPYRPNSEHHAWVGGSAALFMVIEAILGWLHPTDESGRRIFCIVHWFVGSVIHCLGIVNILTSHTMESATMPAYAGVVTLIWIFWHLACHLALAHHVHYVDRELNLKTMRSYTPLPMEAVYREEAPYSMWRLTILGLVIFGSLVTSVFLLLAFGLSSTNSSCDQFFCSQYP